MAIMMPTSDQAVLNRRDAIGAALRAIVPGEGVIDSPAEMMPYESDGLMAYRQPPMVVGPNLDHLMPLKVLPGFPLCRLLFGRG